MGSSQWLFYLVLTIEILQIWTVYIGFHSCVVNASGKTDSDFKQEVGWENKGKSLLSCHLLQNFSNSHFLEINIALNKCKLHMIED